MYSIEQGFIDTINKDPSDDTLKLVYADWLEDQGSDWAEPWRIIGNKNKCPHYLPTDILFPIGWHWFPQATSSSTISLSATTSLPSSCLYFSFETPFDAFVSLVEAISNYPYEDVYERC